MGCFKLISIEGNGVFEILEVSNHELITLVGGISQSRQGWIDQLCAKNSFS